MSKDIRVSSWEHFLQEISKLSSRRYLFRGVPSADHKIIPKIGPSTYFKNYDERSEKYALRRFRSEALPYLTFHPTTELDWLALAQHHGLPTRLLDWSLSPLVAAFFAVSGETSQGDSCVYAYERSTTEDATFDPFVGTDVTFYDPPHISPRIPAQHAAFSVHPKPTTAFEPPELVKILVPAPLRSLFVGMLNVFGIHRASLFPSLDGLADYLTMSIPRWEWHKADEQSPSP